MNNSLPDQCQVDGNTIQDGLLVLLTCNKRTMAGIVNVTRDYPVDYAKVMFGYIMPILLVLTLLTNTLVIIVLAQRHMKTPTNIVLFTMAIADLFTLIPPAPWYIYLFTLGHYDKYLYPPDHCYAYHYMTDVIPTYFHTASIWLALLLAGQRYVYVCHPNLAKTWCTVKHVKMAVVLIFVVDFIHQSPKFFDNTFISVYIETDDKRLHLACKNVLAEWAQNKVAIYLPIYFIFRIFFVYVVPCSMLIYINMVLLYTLRKATCRRTQLKSGKYGQATGTTQDQPGATTTGQQCNSGRKILETNTSFATRPLGSRLDTPGAGTIVVDCSNNNSETNKSKTTTNTTINMLSTPIKEDRFTFSERHGMNYGGTSCESEGEEVEGNCLNAGETENHNTTNNTTMRLSVESNNCTCSTSGTNSASQVVCSQVPVGGRSCHLKRVPLVGGRRQLRSISGEQASKDEEDAGSCPECMVCERAGPVDELEWKQCLCVSNHQLYACSRIGRGTLHPHRNNCSHCSSWVGGTTSNVPDDETECSCQFGVEESDRNLPQLDTKDDSPENAKEELRLRMPKSCSVDSRMVRKSHQASGCSQGCCIRNGCTHTRTLSGRLFEPLPEVSQTQSNLSEAQPIKRARVTSKTSNLEPANSLLTQDEESSVPVIVKTGNNFRARVTRLSAVGDLLRSARDNLRTSYFFATNENPIATNISSNVSRTIDSNRTTLMLIVVVFVFLFVEVPVAAATIVHVVLNLLKEEDEEVDYTVINNIKLFGNFLIIVSYSINFTIYCSMSKKFRDTFKELFLFEKQQIPSVSAAGGRTTRHISENHRKPQQNLNYFASRADIQLSSKSQPNTKPIETTTTVHVVPKKDLV